MKQKVFVEIKQTFTYYKEYEIEVSEELDKEKLQENEELKGLIFDENLEPLDTGLCSVKWEVV